MPKQMEHLETSLLVLGAGLGRLTLEIKLSAATIAKLCEIGLGDSLPLDSLSPFTDEIRKREKNRKQLAKKEHREKVKAEAISIADLLPIPYDSRQFSYYEEPAFSMDDFEGVKPVTACYNLLEIFVDEMSVAFR